MDTEAIDSVVEQHRDADVDALVDGNGDAPWQVEDSDYPPVSMAAEDWDRDCPDYLLNLDSEDKAKLRDKLRHLMYWERLMMHGNAPDRTIDYAGSLASASADIAGLLVKSLLASGITEDKLKEAA